MLPALCDKLADETAFIRFSHVTFSYKETQEEPNLTDISFALDKGETLGIASVHHLDLHRAH